LVARPSPLLMGHPRASNYVQALAPLVHA
jgi:hypothetical protein